MSVVQWDCFSCQKQVESDGIVGRKDECPHCNADLHVCKNCQHYDESSYNECKETSAERVLEKERSNFCDFFSAGNAGMNSASKKEDLLNAAEALFKKK